MEKLKNLRLILVFGFILFLTQGCVEVATAPFEGAATQSRDDESFAEFRDVPYPAIFALEKKKSFTYTRRGVLSGTIVAAGRLNLDELGDYYDRHLPGHGWSPLGEAQGEKLISTWVKDSKVLTIIAQPVSFSIGGDTRLELWISPPHTKSDLGHRTIYQKSTVPENKYSTTPVKESGVPFIGSDSKSGGGKKKGKINEEDL